MCLDREANVSAFYLRKNLCTHIVPLFNLSDILCCSVAYNSENLINVIHASGSLPKSSHVILSYCIDLALDL